LNDTENGMPMGRLAIIPNNLLANGLACPKARLWAISWMAIQQYKFVKIIISQNLKNGSVIINKYTHKMINTLLFHYL